MPVFGGDVVEILPAFFARSSTASSGKHVEGSLERVGVNKLIYS
jgi:hypothetical protein